MNENENTTVKIRTQTFKKAKSILRKDPLAPPLCSFITEAVERLLEEKYSC